MFNRLFSTALVISCLAGSAYADLVWTVGGGTTSSHQVFVYRGLDWQLGQVNAAFAGHPSFGNGTVPALAGQLSPRGQLPSAQLAVGTEVGVHPIFFNNMWQSQVESTGFADQPGLAHLNIVGADLNGDGVDEWVIGSRSATAPGIFNMHVRAGHELGTSIAQLGEIPTVSYLQIDVPAFGSSDVRMAAGDVDGDGKDELVFASGITADPFVQVFKYNENYWPGYLQPMHWIIPYSIGQRAGVWISCGDMNNDGRDDIVCGYGSGRGHVRYFNGSTGSLIDGFLAFDSSNTQGTRVVAGDVDGNGRGDILVLPSWGSSAQPKWIETVSQRTLASGDFLFGTTNSGMRGAAYSVPDSLSAVVQVQGTGLLRVWGYTNGVRKTIRTLAHRLPGGTRIIGIADMDMDTKPDILFQYPESRALFYLKMNGLKSKHFRGLDFACASNEVPVACGAGEGIRYVLLRSQSGGLRVMLDMGSFGGLTREFMRIKIDDPTLAPFGIRFNEGSSQFEAFLFNPSTGQVFIANADGAMTAVSERAMPNWTPVNVFQDVISSRWRIVLRHGISGQLVEWPLNGHFVDTAGIRVTNRPPTTSDRFWTAGSLAHEMMIE